KYNANKYILDLEAARNEIAQKLAGVQNRKFLAFDPAWTYFARDFDLIQVPVDEGKDIKQIAEIALANDIKVIIVSPTRSPEEADLVAQRIGAKVMMVDPIAGDYIRNMQRMSRAFLM
ncbi:MAG: zinc ABC transporter substrate-binding protein, partial [Gammaproteobacteria bacterium]|nr:zinc ABC transporter substrate-binding protein [Gammaproteobacteria bacterium]